MSHLTGEERARYVRGMFGRIANRYDLMNRVMTFGQDTRWRRETVRRLSLTSRQRTLDVGAGTGDLAYEVLVRAPGSTAIAADFSLEMIQQGRQRSGDKSPRWLVADAMALPFATGSFDNIVSGFLLRNVAGLRATLREQARVLRPGGHWACLETTPPAPSALRPLIRLYLRIGIPLLGRLLAGAPDAYQYLPRSTQAFEQPEELSAIVAAAGFTEVGFVRRMFGTIAIHWAIRR